MSNPKISVITPMYNCEHYIIDCIRSVVTQKFGEFEHIIVDDASTDRSAEVVEKLIAALEEKTGDTRFKLLRHEKNMGQGAAIKTGLAITRGKYIRILHADDVFMPNALDSLFKIAEEYNADVVHECSRFISLENGGEKIAPGCKLTIDVCDMRPVDKITLMSNDPNDRVSDWLERGTHVDIMYNLFRRDFWFANGSRFKQVGNNFLFAFCWLISAKTFVKVPKATYIYRAGNPMSITNKKRPVEKIADTINAMFRTVDFLDEFMSTIDFFDDKKYLRELIKIQAMSTIDMYSINRHGFYREKMTPELYDVVERAMKKHFGESGWLAAYYFHIAHEAHHRRKLEDEKLFRDQTSARYLVYPTI